jgi:NADPH-dependent 2,4-dienoyl-CoA reductase/sulfur reductase-like enzyme
MPYARKIAALAQHAPGVPVAALGFIRTPAEAERLLHEGLADFVQVGRPFIADPDWGRKLPHEVRPCIACNGCWGRIASGLPLACVVHPEPLPAPVARPRRVVVVGAGPAGLAAACAAAEGGATVTLFAAGDRSARRLRTAARLPGCAGLDGLADHLERRAARAGVVMRHGSAAVADDILGLLPDEVVLACGAEPGLRERWPESLATAGATLTIVDETGTAFAPTLALHAAASGRRVAFVAAAAGLAAREALVERQRLAARCAAVGIELRDALPGGQQGTVLLAVEPRPAADALARELDGRVRLRRVGDCHGPGTLADALAAGEACGVPLRRPSR